MFEIRRPGWTAWLYYVEIFQVKGSSCDEKVCELWPESCVLAHDSTERLAELNCVSGRVFTQKR